MLPEPKQKLYGSMYDLFRTLQPKGDEKVRYHARSVVTGKMATRNLTQDIARRSAFKDPMPGCYGDSFYNGFVSAINTIGLSSSCKFSFNCFSTSLSVSSIERIWIGITEP